MRNIDVYRVPDRRKNQYLKAREVRLGTDSSLYMYILQYAIILGSPPRGGGGGGGKLAAIFTNLSVVFSAAFSTT